MKKILALLTVIALCATTSWAQRYAIIDSKYILDKVPEYQQAQAELDALSKTWQTEIDAKMAEVEKLYKSYQAERPMLSDDVRKKREEEIIAKEKSAKDLQKQRSGYEGDLFKQQQLKVKPVQDKDYNVVQNIITLKRYDHVLDKIGGVNLFYIDTISERCSHVLKLLGKAK